MIQNFAYRSLTMLLDLLILEGIKQFDKERSLSAVLHLLSGRVSVQTKQDAQLFKLLHLYGTTPFLTETLYTERISSLVTKNYVSLQSNEAHKYGLLLDKGKKALQEVDNTAIQYFSNINFNQEREKFLTRTYLFTQTIANIGNGNYHFIPIIDCFTTKRWMKKVYQSFKGREGEYLSLFHKELKLLLQQLKMREAEMFVDRLTGIHSFGLSMQQLAFVNDCSIYDIYITIHAISERFINLIQENKKDFIIFQMIMPKMSKQKNISASAQSTLRLLNEGFSLEAISLRRNLQLNTIHDHIVEIALSTEDFPIRPYVSKQVEKQVQEVAVSLKTRRLKDIKEAFSNKQVDYFQIRLALARLKN